MELTKLTGATEGALSSINVLLKQLSDRVPACTHGLLAEIVRSDSLELWVATDGGQIVGMGELAIVRKPEGIVAQIEDVVVDESQRGKNIGTEIMQKLIERAREHQARVIQLSSRASRVAANKLYQKLGFQLHETNSYHLML